VSVLVIVHAVVVADADGRRGRGKEVPGRGEPRRAK